jgi:hypothetical protein
MDNLAFDEPIVATFAGLRMSYEYCDSLLLVEMVINEVREGRAP